jgi:hypothetical protein
MRGMTSLCIERIPSPIIILENKFKTILGGEMERAEAVEREAERGAQTRTGSNFISTYVVFQMNCSRTIGEIITHF